MCYVCLDVAYMFQDMASLRKEELETSGDTTQEYYLDMDTTAESEIDASKLLCFGIIYS